MYTAPLCQPILLTQLLDISSSYLTERTLIYEIIKLSIIKLIFIVKLEKLNKALPRKMDSKAVVAITMLVVVAIIGFGKVESKYADNFPHETFCAEWWVDSDKCIACCRDEGYGVTQHPSLITPNKDCQCKPKTMILESKRCWREEESCEFCCKKIEMVLENHNKYDKLCLCNGW